MITATVAAIEPQEGHTVPPVKKELPPGCGFVPPPVRLDHLAHKHFPRRLEAAELPTKWDWRTAGKVTSVKNQSTCGACYAFASLGVFEAQVLIADGGTYDFSENNAKECNFYDRSCGGGNFYDMADLYSKKGVVLESCDPYVASDVSCNTSCASIKTLLDWCVISSNNIPSPTDLKNYILSYGPVYTTIYAGDGSDPAWNSEFSSYDGSYTLYYTGTYTPNHAVVIVGWDDSLVHSGGMGGWIVKNSWGTNWGGTCGYGTEKGYFTIAYGSASIGKWSSFIADWQDYDVNGDVLYYDEGGYTNYWGFGTTTAWGLCKFIMPSTQYVTRVEFWTTDATTDVDVYIYNDFNGSLLSNLIVSKLDTSFSEAGYHSVPLGTAAPEIAAGEDIFVAVKFTNATFTYPVVTDNVGPSTGGGVTYLSSNGSTWYDMGANYANDVGIRVRTSPTLALSVDDENTATPNSYHLSYNYPNPFNPTTTISYSLPHRSHVNISIYNIAGERVTTLIDETKPAGEHIVTWDGTDYRGMPVATGVYFYTLKTDDYSSAKKMLLLK